MEIKLKKIVDNLRTATRARGRVYVQIRIASRCAGAYNNVLVDFYCETDTGATNSVKNHEK